MRLHFQPWQLAFLIALLCGCAVFGVIYYRSNVAASSPADLLAHLPANNATLLYIDVDALRNARLLDLLSVSKATEESEYREFVEQTSFNYSEDLDAIAVAIKEGQIFFALRGRFNWKRIMSYTTKQGGTCSFGVCEMKGSKPDRNISFYAVRPNVMALAISPDKSATYQIVRRAAAALDIPRPDKPIWMLVSPDQVRTAKSLPAGTRPFLSALDSTNRIVLTAGPSGDHLEVALHVTCKSVDAASNLLVQLEANTNTLRKWIAREHQQANPNDLSGVLTAGAFRRDGVQVDGTWPLPKSFVETVASGAY